MRLTGPVSLITLSLAACGAPGLYLDDAGDRGTGGGAPDALDSGRFTTADGGAACMSDGDCGQGLVCVRSTGECVLPENMMHVDDPDAGQQYSCADGTVVTCGVSKIGECRIGTSTCVNGSYAACVGAVNPLPDVCNGRDDDCDGLIDEDLPDLTCGLGECRRSTPSCSAGVPVSCVPGSPSAELCNGLDDDCDGMTDEGFSDLSCGLGACLRTVTACVMGHPQTCTPGMPATEICNGADDDCDGMIDESLGSTTCGTGSCQRTVVNCVNGQPRTCNPGSPSTEICNGLDDDCDGMTDEGLGTLSCGTGACARSVAACTGGVPGICMPGTSSPELCNGVDDDCDGQTDEGLLALSCGTGACARTVPACFMGMPQLCVAGMPGTEICNNVDDDCDGATDESLGSTTCGTGACVRTVQNCVNGQTRSCTPGSPGTETCNNVDDDCDGQTDEGLGNITCGVGACQRSVAACTGGVAGTCTPGTAGTETCNGIDDDCDGTVDDGVCTPIAMCPAGQTVAPNTTVNLTTSASSPSGRPLSCQWSVVSRPATSSGTFSSPTSCTSSGYFADVVGTHTLRFTVTDSLGVSSSCTVNIVVNALGDLWIELTWSRANDMDLHLQHPSAGNSHSANGWSFNASGYDCYYGDTNPSWDSGGTADDPSLDRDDITGTGPENIRINSPSTSHDYTIGVHMYSYDASPRTVTATVKVYCNGVLTTTQSRGFATQGDMWVVGKVRFASSGGCTFTPDGYVFNL